MSDFMSALRQVIQGFGLSCSSSPKGICFCSAFFCYPPSMPVRECQFWVSILSSCSRELHVGMTNALIARTTKHREHVAGTYTARYAIDRLVYFEYFQYVNNAIAREKALKRCSRAQKIELIERLNPTWEDSFSKLAAPAMTWEQAQADVEANKTDEGSDGDEGEIPEADPPRG